MTDILQLTDVRKTFEADPPVEPLRGANLNVASGQLASIAGASGKGKTTLLNVAGGIMKPDAGRVLFKGEDLGQAPAGRIDQLHRCGIGFVFQTPYLMAALTVRENLEAAQRIAGLRKDRAQVDGLLDELGLAERCEALPHELSVGQRRRVAFARVLLADHDLVLADEPTNDLDAQWSDFVFGRLQALAHEQGKAVVLVTHDERYAARADARYVLEDGLLARLDAAGGKGRGQDQRPDEAPEAS